MFNGEHLYIKVSLNGCYRSVFT